MRRVSSWSSPLERSIAVACNVYVSEGRDAAILRALERRAEGLSDATCANVFVDEAYHRAGYTFVALASRRSRFADDVVSFASYAADHVDLRFHEANHPRLGAVDHILCAAFDASGADAAPWAAKEVALRIAEGFAHKCKASVATYGGADEEGRSLVDVRRALGYFRGSATGTWEGSVEVPEDGKLLLRFGPKSPSARTGVAIVGSCGWVVNYNVPIDTMDLQLAAQIARSVSARGGGIPGVQAMALPHKAGGIEIACNLLDPQRAGPELVQNAVELLAKKCELQVGEGYIIGKAPSQLWELAVQMSKG